MKFKPYPEYKDSGVEWIDELPKKWDFRRIKTLSVVRRGASPRPIDDPKYFDENGDYSWVRIADVTSSSKYLYESTENLSPLGKSLSVPLEPGELFISIAGSVGKPIITKIKCCIHDGFVYFQDLRINPEYLYYIFISGQAYQGLGKLGTQLNLNTETIGSINIPFPSNEEQIKISNFLDKKTSEIDLTIEKDTRLIELLKEKRTALINHVVTKGLDPKVKMKDSGVEWIGEIPEDWEIRKFSHIADSIVVGYVGSIESFYTDENNGVPLLKTGNVGYGELNLDNLHYVTRDFHLMNKKSQLKPGDIVIARHGESGRSSVVPTCMEEANCLNIVVLKSSSEMDGNYYSYVLNSHLIQEHLQAIQGGAVQGVINTEDISFLNVFHPPLLQQKEIAKYLKLETTKIEKIISKIQDKISFLDEYKKSLIHHVVTGKVNVTKED